MIRALAHRVRARAQAAFGPSAMILTYHRVADLERDPQLLAVSRANFASQAEMLAARHTVIPLADLVADLRAGCLRDRVVVLTFDDGYHDNLANARPIIESCGLSATVFVSSGYLNGDREFWWDEAERIVLAREPADGWNVLEPPRTQAHRTYNELVQSLRPLPADAREVALAVARERFGVAPELRPTHRPMTEAEVAELDRSPAIRIGAHTVSHEVLSLLDPDAQRATIKQDKAALEHLCEHEMGLFSYPYGGRDDYNDITVGIVREAGFAAACANHPALVKQTVDPLRLPRFVVRDWTGDELAHRIEAWFMGHTETPR